MEFGGCCHTISLARQPKLQPRGSAPQHPSALKAGQSCEMGTGNHRCLAGDAAQHLHLPLGPWDQPAARPDGCWP